MKKIIYYLTFLILLLIINSLPVSAKEIKTCTRTETNLHVRDKFNLGTNKDDILNTPCVDDMDKIYDFANLISDEDEDKLYQVVTNFINLSNYDLALVTTNENPKYSEVEYADDFYDYNMFGKNETRDGLLILIDMYNRRVYVSTTGYAIKMFDDTRIDTIIDAGYLELKNADYYNCLHNMVLETLNLFNLGYPESNSNMLINENGDPYFLKYISYPLVIFIASLVTLIVSLILYFKTRLKIKKANTVSYLKKKDLTTKTDQLVNSTVTHTRIVSSSSGSGGGSSGGSSFHSSSSGSSHGGGGRSF